MNAKGTVVFRNRKRSLSTKLCIGKNQIYFYRKEKAMAKLSYRMIGLLIMIGIQVEGLTDTNLTQVPIMREFWFLMGLLFAAGKMELEERNQHEV